MWAWTKSWWSKLFMRSTQSLRAGTWIGLTEQKSTDNDFLLPDQAAELRIDNRGSSHQSWPLGQDSISALHSSANASFPLLHTKPLWSPPPLCQRTCTQADLSHKILCTSSPKTKKYPGYTEIISYIMKTCFTLSFLHSAQYVTKQLVVLVIYSKLMNGQVRHTSYWYFNYFTRNYRLIF